MSVSDVASSYTETEFAKWTAATSTIEFQAYLNLQSHNKQESQRNGQKVDSAIRESVSTAGLEEDREI